MPDNAAICRNCGVPNLLGVSVIAPNKFRIPPPIETSGQGAGVPNLLGCPSPPLTSSGFRPLSRLRGKRWNPQLVGGVRRRPEQVQDSALYPDSGARRWSPQLVGVYLGQVQEPNAVLSEVVVFEIVWDRIPHPGIRQKFLTVLAQVVMVTGVQVLRKALMHIQCMTRYNFHFLTFDH